MTITRFDRQNIRVLQQECEAALRAVAEKHGLTVHAAGGTFDDDFWSGKFKFQPTSTDAAQEVWNKFCGLYRLPPDGVGRTIYLKSKPFTITGLVTNARRMCVTIQDANGRPYRTTADVVQKQLGMVDPFVEGGVALAKLREVM